jgi:hypothetical protein
MTPNSHDVSAPVGVIDRIAGWVLPPFGSLGSGATLVAPLVIVLGVSLATAEATRAWGWALAAGPAGPPPEALRAWIWVIAMASPVIAVLKGGVLALVAWALLVLIGAPSGFRPVLGALLYGEAILSLQGPALLLTLLVQGGARPGGVPVPTGLDILVDPGHPVLFSLARGVTPFHVAWVGFLALALAACAGTSRRRGLVVSAALWSMLVALAALRAVLTRGAA